MALAGVVVLAGVVLATVLDVRQGDGPVRPVDFWPAFAAHGSEAFVPQDIGQISQSADAIVLAHVVGLTEGRDIVPDEDTTPRDASVPALTSCYVYLGVDEVVAGDVPAAERGRLRLELFAPALPDTVEDMRSDLPSGQALFYLWNGAAAAARHGAPEPIQLREQSNWLAASSFGVLIAGTHQVEAALHPGEPGTPFLRSFGTNDLKVAARRSADARRR